MAAFVFLAAGLIARIRSGEVGWGLFLSLGLVLGLGYLSKSFMFSMALVFLGLAWLVQGRTRKSVSRTGLALGVFLLISLPFILLISEKKGMLTIGEAGTVTYVRYVNGIPFPHWQGDLLRGVVPVHPSRIVHQSPPVYEFGEPIGGTYPISTDPSYWYEGIEPRLDFPGLLARLLNSGLDYMEIFFQAQGFLFAAVLAMYLMARKQTITILEVLQRWALVIPALIAFGLYGMVLVAGRYIGVFVLLFWTDILANIWLSDAGENRKWIRVLGSLAAFGLLVNIVLFNLDGFGRLNQLPASGVEAQAAPAARPLEVAQMLQELGINPGDKVGVIGYAYDSFWARLARVRIVAEMLEADAIDFWHADKALQQGVLQAFFDAGVKAVVAEYVPDDAALSGWQRVGDSNYHIYLFREQ